MNANQADRATKTSLEFANELGADGYTAPSDQIGGAGVTGGAAEGVRAGGAAGRTGAAGGGAAGRTGRLRGGYGR
jgi:hypothetical protein